MPRVMELVTPLGEDVLRFHTMTASETMSRPFEYEIEALGERNDLDPDKLLGQTVTVRLELPQGPPRCFNAHVVRFGLAGMVGRHHRYRLSCRPWLWLLTRSSDCRIFQRMKVPDIVREVFAKYSAARFELRLSARYREWEYCVQYRESDFNFVSRLLEQEGVYYFFAHAEGRHTLVLCDSPAAHSPCAGYEQLRYLPVDRAPRLGEEYLSQWSFRHEIETGAFVLGEFDFTRPSVDLEVQRKEKRAHAFAELECFDYPGEYESRDAGEHYVRARLEELQCQRELYSGTSNARGPGVGHLFKLSGQGRRDQNQEYLLLAARLELRSGEYEAMTGEGAHFSCAFEAMPSRETFRPLRSTPRPIVQGPQTALVVGPAGDEIYTDEYGRVKVQFHWDRYGEKDEESSCWIRVSHPWAGKNWGMVAMPRIGQEVIVDFLEGDPDRPIITGRLYNAEQRPPWELPANMTQTGVLTRSSQAGLAANANAIRFEDKKDAEQLWIHAERNQDLEVEHDETHWVGHDRRKTIDHDERTQIGHDRTETVRNNETITVGVNRTEQVGANESVTIGGAKTETVVLAKAETIGAAKALSIGAGYAVTVGGAMNTAVGLASFEEVGLARTTVVGRKYSIAVGDELEIIVGKASLVMRADGTVLINGSQFDFTASGPVVINGQDVDINPGGLPYAPAPPAGAGAGAARAARGPIQTGLGDDVDELAAKSPSLQGDLQKLKEEGWQVRYGAAGAGSYAKRKDKEIVIDGNEKGNAVSVTQTLAHEVGHAMHPYQADYSSKASYVDGAMADEGAATLHNIKVQREIVANGGANIGIAGNSTNHAAYNKAYDKFLEDGDASGARRSIGSLFGQREVTSNTGQSYADYYGAAYDKALPPKK